MSRAGQPQGKGSGSAVARSLEEERVRDHLVSARQVAGGICHRAKNDLQTLSNLMALAAPYARTPAELSEALDGRIGAMSVSYTLVAQSGAPPRLDRLAEEVVRRAKWRLTAPLDFDNQLPSLEISLRLCSPLSLWLHEMVVNALAHGLARVQHPKLLIAGQVDGDTFQISVVDNGPGLAPGFDISAQAGLGLKIAQAVARSDLRGRMELKTLGEGLQARLEFPAHEFERLNRNLWN